MTPHSRSSSRLILVSNRLPVALEKDPSSGALRLRRTLGGLATGLSRPHRELQGSWIGWPGTHGRELSDEAREVLESEGFRGVGLDEEEYERYYLGVCNGCIWPLLHGFVERFQFDAGDWEVYRRVNQRFADAVLEVARPGDSVFIQDFHLALVPQLVRRALPVRIGFFLHVPFPPTGIFRALPERGEFLRGLLGADVIGFHTLEYLRSFRSTVRRALGADTTSHSVEHEGRRVELVAKPLGIDTAPWSRPDTDPDVAREIEDLKQAANGRRVIVGVERLDYTKGIPERLAAFRELLATHPGLVDDIVFFQIAVPSRVDVEDYRDLKEEVERIAGEINGRFGRIGMQPLHYQFHGVDQARLTALYRIADVCVVTPLRDGLNLVAKEFVAARRSNDGVLLLSEFTGAAWELTEALQVNPYDIQGITTALERALAMPPAEQAARMAPMRERVHRDDVHGWTEAFLTAIRGAERRSPPQPFDEASLSELGSRFSSASSCVLALDWDGTLRELEPTPDAAGATPQVLALLERLCALAGVEVWIVSGRDMGFLIRELGQLDLGLVGEHGAFVRAPGEREPRTIVSPPSPDWRDMVRPLLDDATSRVPGSLVEEKPLGMAWHYRAAEPEFAVWQAYELYLHLGEVLAGEPLEVMRGSKVLEIRPAGVSKARGLEHVLSDRRSRVTSSSATQSGAPELLLVAGDDITDESLFRAFPDAVSILVGERASAARYRVDRPVDLRELLAKLAELASQREGHAP